jgi:dTDP-4-amino-4,6-dideoxygalactose transaminase
MHKRVYLSPPHVFGDEQKLIADAFASNWIAPLGPHVDAFERELQAVVGMPHAAALSSGTAAVHLAVVVLGVSAGDAVICSSFTFTASANAILYQNAEPVFVDSDESWTIDPNRLEDALKSLDAKGRQAKAVIAVDLYGQCADYEPILGLCQRYGVSVIEDAADSLGATYKGLPAGSFGRLGIFSFNGNKVVTTAGGGMLVSREADLIDRARFLATQARDQASHYEHTQLGYNYRLSNVLAAIGRAQLKSLPQRVEARRLVFERYRSGLGDLPGIEFMPERPNTQSSRWLTTITVDPARFGADREAIRLALEAENIESRPVWKPLHLQPLFAGAQMFGGAVSERLFRTGLCLPGGSSLEPEDQDRVIAVVRRTCRG